MKMNSQQLGSIFTDIRDKVENALVSSVNSSLTPSAPVAVQAKPATATTSANTIAGMSIPVVGGLALLAAYAWKQLR